MKNQISVQQKKTDIYHEQLRLNVVIFEDNLEPVKCGFYRMPDLTAVNGNGLIKLPPHRLPVEYQQKDPASPVPLYTRFEDDKEAPVRIKADPLVSRFFYRALMNHRIERFFRGKNIMVSRNFVDYPEVWVKLKVQPDNRFVRFDRYVLKFTLGEYTDSAPELLITHKGTSDVLKMNLEQLSDKLSRVNARPQIDDKEESADPLDDVTRVVSSVPDIGHYDDIVQEEGHRLRDFYPVVNYTLRKKLGLPFKRKRIEKKIRKCSEKIRAFYTAFIDTDEFREATGLSTGRFYVPEKEEANRADVSSHVMMFGGGKKSIDVNSAMGKYGPWRSTPAARPKILLIVPRGEEIRVEKKIINPLLGGTGNYPGIKRFAGIPLAVHDKPIVFSNRENPLPEIEKALGRRRGEFGEDTIAFYISPISKDEPDPEKRQVYYRVKERLLQDCITSQTIDLEKIKEKGSKRFWMPNLALATLAKLGGIPWKTGSEARRELVIGLGAFQPAWSPYDFVGSAICFENSGLMRGFDCFDSRNTQKLAGMIKAALQQFIREYGNAERVVIHYYKVLRRDDAEPIRKMLEELSLDIPVYVVTVNKPGSGFELAIDKAKEHRMPYSGTYIHLGRHRYLLFNNTRYRVAGRDAGRFPMPLKLQIQTVGETAQGDDQDSGPGPEVVKELMNQLMQFSRMYYKSVAPQPMPVTVRYPEMLAQQVPYFKNNRLPEFGKRNMFFL